MTSAAARPTRSHRALSPAQHAIADYATAATFAIAGVVLRRRHRAAATLALFHAAGVLAGSLLTRYPGGLVPAITFRTHGRLDLLMAATNALGPTLLGFAEEPEAAWFHGATLMELGVVSATDFSARA